MAGPRRRFGGAWWIGATAAVVLVVVVAMVSRLQRAPDGPMPIVWDREACAHCRMLLSEPAFAAQLQLTDGRVLNFDDPGCLFKHLEGLGANQVKATWFHHYREDRWISGDEVRFVRTSPTPMQWGLGAVTAGSGGLSLAEAQADLPRGPPAHEADPRAPSGLPGRAEEARP